MAGTLYIVATPIGNLGDMSHRGVEVLKDVDVILAEDTRRTRILLDHFGIEPTALKSYHEHNEAARTEEIRERMAADSSVALVSDSGTPLVSDPGLRLVRAALDVGARVVPVPGASAALAALVASGLDAQPFTFYGFVPRGGRERSDLMADLASTRHTAVLFESPQRLARTLAAMSEALGGERQVVVARELTKIHEEFYRGTLDEVAAHYGKHAPRGEVVICLAAALPAETVSDEELLAAARALVDSGASSKQIVSELRERFGLERNRAYSIALAAAESDN